jgi:signal transduction histidine kinase
VRDSEIVTAPLTDTSAEIPMRADGTGLEDGQTDTTVSDAVSDLAAEHDPVQAYARILGEYFTNRAEEALYQASLLSQRFVDEGFGPEEIIAIHAEALELASRNLSYRERARCSTDALQFLLEMMITYGVQYRAYLELRLRERDRETEARISLERQRVTDAERSETEKEEILATITHELRTPITVAMGNVDLGLRNVELGRTDRLPRQLTAAREALGRLSRLTDELVDASRDGSMALELSHVDAGQILKKACDWAKPTAQEKQLTLTWDAPDGCWVVADADALLTIFGNLLSNAIRYTPEAGRVTARCGSETDHVWFSVTDTGIGMTLETKARIFDKFFRAADARYAEPRGLGLGLSIALRLITSLGGDLTVESEPGHGSTFRVELPRATAHATSEEIDDERLGH